MTGFRITPAWDSIKAPAANEIEATLCNLMIAIGKSNITEYRDGGRSVVRSLHTPAYFIAEWLAENWWALLHEPRKSEEGDDRDFLARHSLLAAQHGFALPALEIVPVGQAIHVSTTRHSTRLANAEFANVAVLDISREELRPILAEFIGNCVTRLEALEVSGTPLSEAWLRVQETQPEEEAFCELAGSLGLSPYSISQQTADAIDQIEEALGYRAARDFCLAVDENKLLSTASSAEWLVRCMDASNDATIAPLTRMLLPSDNFKAPSWRRGLHAARSVMSEFNISASDSRGADKVFDHLRVDLSHAAPVGAGNTPDLPFSAAVRRVDDLAKISLFQPEETRRRFAAARSIYLAWASESRSTRLTTNAVTRDQQASRQFAAEILVPRRLLESQSNSGRLHIHVVYEIARTRNASPEIVQWQAQNSGIQISSI